MKCPNCNNKIPDGSKFCNHCGSKIEELTKNCPNPECGRTGLPPEAVYCADCGCELENFESNENFVQSTSFLSSGGSRLVGEHLITEKYEDMKFSGSYLSSGNSGLVGAHLLIEKKKKEFDVSTKVKDSVSKVESNKENNNPFVSIDGVILGKTTREEILKLRDSGEVNGSIVMIKGVYFHWNPNGIVNLFSFYSGMPPEWKRLGAKWNNSYNQWIEFFRENNFEIKIKSAPSVVYYNEKEFAGFVLKRRKTFKAKIEGVNSQFGFSITLDFQFGNDHGEGHSADSKNSLFRIDVRLL